MDMPQPAPDVPFALRRLLPEDAEVYRALRLEGLALHPAAFGSSWEEEVAHPLDWFAGRLRDHVVLGGWCDGLGLSGVAGLMVPTTAKLRHKGLLWGMYVRVEARGTGLARALVAGVIAAAQGRVEALNLTVSATNEPAGRLYRSLGFREYAREERALKVAGVYYDEALMTLWLPP